MPELDQKHVARAQTGGDVFQPPFVHKAFGASAAGRFVVDINAAVQKRGQRRSPAGARIDFRAVGACGGIAGDEDGGATSAFVVFSQLGFFPTNIGYPIYDFGTPFFTKATINLKDGKKIKFVAHNVSDKNKYVDSMKIDGKPYDKSWISHSDLLKASKIEFFMSDKPNKQRAATKDLLPDFLK